MKHPVAGQEMPEDERKARAEASRVLTSKAKETRRKAVEELVSGKIELDDLCSYSLTDKENQDALYLSRLPLTQILLAYPNWDKEAVETALVQTGFGLNSTIKTIRSHAGKRASFQALIDSPEKWRVSGHRVIPAERAGWPWKTKVGAIADELGISLEKALGTSQKAISNNDVDIEEFLLDDESRDTMKSSADDQNDDEDILQFLEEDS